MPGGAMHGGPEGAAAVMAGFLMLAFVVSAVPLWAWAFHRFARGSAWRGAACATAVAGAATLALGQWGSHDACSMAFLCTVAAGGATFLLALAAAIAEDRASACARKRHVPAAEVTSSARGDGTGPG